MKPEVSLPASVSEDVFLNNAAKISPVNMQHSVIRRSLAILDCVVTLLESEDVEINKESIRSSLWQVEGNLEELRKIGDVWHKSQKTKRRRRSD